MERWQLQQKQGQPLEIKELMTLNRIRQFYEFNDGQVYVSYSGGVDSEVLAHLARRIKKDIPIVFVDTGLEWPENKKRAKDIGAIKIKPKMNYRQVLINYGYPVISKEQAQYIYEARNTNSTKLYNIRIYGNKWGRGKVAKKWQFLLSAPFKISHKCCDIMKKEPAKRYEKQTGRAPLIGSMTEESQLRKTHYLKTGCNSFNSKRPLSNPLAFWTKKDIWEYIKKHSLEYSTIYDKGYTRTGCIFCIFGEHKEPEPNKFQTMAQTHPKLYNYCINKLELSKVLDYIGVPYKPVTKYSQLEIPTVKQK